MLVDMTHANEQRPAATGNAADNVSDAPTGPRDERGGKAHDRHG